MTHATENDPFDLNRFVEAQQPVYTQALAEIRRGAKRSHWMWYIFPQIAGLGSSAMAQHYAIRSIAEAQACLAHPVLGIRYAESVATLQKLSCTTAEQVFGSIDAVKLRSSLTLFCIASDTPLYRSALLRWFDAADDATLQILGV